jgi:hypothetical protein
LACGAFAQVTPNLDQGTKSIAVDGSYDNDHPRDYELNLGAAFGYHIRDGVELLGGVDTLFNDDYRAWLVGGGIDLNLITDNVVVPFIGVSAYWAGVEVDIDDDDDVGDDDDLDEDGAVGEARAGVKIFLDDDVALSFAAQFRAATEDIWADEDGDPHDTNLTVVMGIRYYWD